MKPMKLPNAYVCYFAGDGPKEGGLSVDPGWFQLWSPDEVEGLNRDYQVQEFIPGLFGFGSSGGGELLAFDEAGRIFMIPFIGMSLQAAKQVAGSWIEFIERIER
jgi:hypothetical protein